MYKSIISRQSLVLVMTCIDSFLCFCRSHRNINQTTQSFCSTSLAVFCLVLVQNQGTNRSQRSGNFHDCSENFNSLRVNPFGPWPNQHPLRYSTSLSLKSSCQLLKSQKLLVNWWMVQSSHLHWININFRQLQFVKFSSPQWVCLKIQP